jgi:hypothetical protein
MSDEKSEGSGHFDSLDCVDLILDESQCEKPVGPCPPEILARLKAEREKFLRWGGKIETVNLEIDG